MIEKKEVLKYLVLDIDNCLHSKNFKDHGEHYLSKDLIEKAKTGGYKGFYLCTHRAYETYKIGLSLYQFFGQETKSWETPEIIEAFQNLTGLQCIGVSTVDDIHYKECGEAYRRMIKHDDDEQLYVENPHCSVPEIIVNYISKNEQLVQITHVGYCVKSHAK